MKLLLLLILIESSGNDSPIPGDNGLAHGCLQIHACVVTDVNKKFKTTYTWPEDCYSREKSLDIATKYLSIYATEKRIGRPVTDEDRARIWNGGPNGWKKESTVAYWKRCVERQALIQRETNAVASVH